MHYFIIRLPAARLNRVNMRRSDSIRTRGMISLIKQAYDLLNPAGGLDRLNSNGVNIPDVASSIPWHFYTPLFRISPS